MRAVVDGGPNFSSRHRGPQKEPAIVARTVLPPVPSSAPTRLFGLWDEASDGLNRLSSPKTHSPIAAIGDAGQQALGNESSLGRNARANFERDIISQLQQDVKFTLLDRLDVDRSSSGRASWQAGTDAAKGANRRPVQAVGSVNDFPPTPLTTTGVRTLQAIAEPAKTAMAPMQPTAPSAPLANAVRRPHPGISSAPQAQQDSSREIPAEPDAPATASGAAASSARGTTAGMDTAADIGTASADAIAGHADPNSPRTLMPNKDGGVAANADPDSPRTLMPTHSASRNSLESSSSFKSEEEQEALRLAQHLMAAEMEALEQTLSPHYVLVGAEKEVLEAALAIARMDVQQEAPAIVGGAKNKRNSLISKMAGHGDALLSFVPKTIRRCIAHQLVTIEQWKVLLESPLNSWYDPVLSRFPAAVVFADASGFTKLTETLARQPQGAEKIGMTLNNFFGPLIALVQKHGGDIIKFSGDALTIIWAAAEPAPKDAAREAARQRMSAAMGYARSSGLRRSSNELRPRRKSSDNKISEGRRASGTPSAGGASETDEQDAAGLPKITRKRRRSITESHCQSKKEVEMAASVAAVVHAASFCLEVQREIHKFGRTPVPNCSLTMHIGVGFGDLALLQLGGLMGRWEYCIAGKALDQIAIAEPLAHSGETVFSPEARELAESGIAGRPEFAFEEVEEAPDGTPPGFAKLIGVKQRFSTTIDLDDRVKEQMNKEVLSWWMDNPEDAGLDVRLVKRYVPSAVALRLACAPEAESVTYPEEMRRISVVFLSIAGLDPYSTQSDPVVGLTGGRKAQLLMRLMQRSVYALEGSVNKFLVDDKGVLLLVCFGLPPLIHFTDDPIRAVLCAMRLRDCLKDEGLEGRVGVATGQCWCGVVGTEIRREYTVLGDTVNLAARLMGKAPVNQVLVDATTREISSSVLEFDEGDVLRLKGKVEAVRAFRFLHTRKGLKRHRKQPEQSLISWKRWPALVRCREALGNFETKSGVIFISGPGGGGKTELAETVRSWAASKGWTLLAGQNMDPSGTFVLPRLSLQEAFQELVKLVSKDPFWRSQAWELLTSSVGQKAKRKKSAMGVPTHAELYWMLNAMLRSSGGAQAAADLEPWMPLLSLAITQLAFAPRMVSAMAERDEQHARNNRFAELCAGVMDAFSKYGSATGGTVLLLHIRRSSAFFQSKDGQEASAIRALAELCMNRRRAAKGEAEKRPILLCVVSRENVLKDSSVLQFAAECGGLVEAEDLSHDDTTAYMDHLTRLRARAPKRSRYSSDQLGKEEDESSPSEGEAEEEKADASTPEKEDDSHFIVGCSQAEQIVAEYVYDMTGGNPLAILVVFKQLCQRGVLRRDQNNPQHYRLDLECHDAAWLRQNVPVPESLVGMAFSNFERLDPREQMVLKAATTFEGPFGVVELSAALPKIRPEDLRSIIKRLESKSARAIRKATAREALLLRHPSLSSLSGLSPKGDQPDDRYQFYSGLLRHAASTLVLEAQRTEVRRNSALALSMLNLQNLRDLSSPQVSPAEHRRSQQERASAMGMGAIMESDACSDESGSGVEELQEMDESHY